MRLIATWDDLFYPGKATNFFKIREFPAFQPDAIGYSPVNALWLAELSRLIYRHDIEESVPPPLPTRTSFLPAARFKQRQFFLSWETDTQAMLVETTGTPTFAVLVFRGTEQTLKDQITDLAIGSPPNEQNKIEVHDGFTKALDSVWHEIETALTALPPDCPVYYTGHSLGAALATLSATRRAPKAVYTFGSPRVGNQAFVNSLANIPIYRVVDDEDIVTTIPPENLGFRHVGEEHMLIAPKSTPPLNHLFEPPKSLADHAPIIYVSRIII